MPTKGLMQPATPAPCAPALSDRRGASATATGDPGALTFSICGLQRGQCSWRRPGCLSFSICGPQRGRCNWRPRRLDLLHLRNAEGPKYDFAGEQLHWERTPHRQGGLSETGDPGALRSGARGAAEGPKYDFAGEQLHWEGTPHRGDLVTNLALGATLLWLPLTAAAVGRGAFMKFRFTDKRVSVITSGRVEECAPREGNKGFCALCHRNSALRLLAQMRMRSCQQSDSVPTDEHGYDRHPLVRALRVLVGCPGAARLLKPQGEGRDAPAGGCLHDPGPLEQALLTAVSCMFKGSWRLLPPGMTQVLWVHACFRGALQPLPGRSRANSRSSGVPSVHARSPYALGRASACAPCPRAGGAGTDGFGLG